MDEEATKIIVVSREMIKDGILEQAQAAAANFKMPSCQSLQLGVYCYRRETQKTKERRLIYFQSLK